MTDNSETQKLVEHITDFVNSYSMKPLEFIEAMESEHRTLQQSFTKLCLLWIENCASDAYRYDGRNEASHNISAELIQLFKQVNHDIAPSSFLPLI